MDLTEFTGFRGLRGFRVLGFAVYGLERFMKGSPKNKFGKGFDRSGWSIWD